MWARWGLENTNYNCSKRAKFVRCKSWEGCLKHHSGNSHSCEEWISPHWMNQYNSCVFYSSISILFTYSIHITHNYLSLIFSFTLAVQNVLKSVLTFLFQVSIWEVFLSARLEFKKGHNSNPISCDYYIYFKANNTSEGGMLH